MPSTRTAKSGVSLRYTLLLTAGYGKRYSDYPYSFVHSRCLLSQIWHDLFEYFELKKYNAAYPHNKIDETSKTRIPSIS